MSVDTSKWQVQDYLNVAPLVGLRASNFVPSSFDSLASAVAQRNVPARAPSGFVTLCTACLIARGMITWKNAPGDCDSPTQITPSDTEQVAVGIASMAAQQLPGIGAFVGAIQSVFQHHDIAVANEQATNCKVMGIINQVFYYYDNQVREGNISPSTAYAGIQAYIQQVNGQLASIEKSCNAACVWQGVLAAHADFCQTYYPAIAPVSIFAHAPGAPPANLGTTPGGVVQVGGQQITLPVVGSIPQTELYAGIALILIVLVIMFAG